MAWDINLSTDRHPLTRDGCPFRPRQQGGSARADEPAKNGTRTYGDRGLARRARLLHPLQDAFRQGRLPAGRQSD